MVWRLDGTCQPWLSEQSPANQGHLEVTALGLACLRGGTSDSIAIPESRAAPGVEQTPDEFQLKMPEVINETTGRAAQFCYV